LLAREGGKLFYRAALVKKYGGLSSFMKVHKMVSALIFLIIFSVGEMRNVYKILVGKLLKGRYHLKELDINGKKILKWILKK
jgi:hypothetical protein